MLQFHPKIYVPTQEDDCIDYKSTWIYPPRLDMNDEELSAKGSGGFRQMHSYASINQVDKIETPEEDYSPDKIGEVDLGKIEAARNNEIPKQQMRI